LIPVTLRSLKNRQTPFFSGLLKRKIEAFPSGTKRAPASRVFLHRSPFATHPAILPDSDKDYNSYQSAALFKNGIEVP
jgi:hypothetical protein